MPKPGAVTGGNLINLAAVEKTKQTNITKIWYCSTRLVTQGCQTVKCATAVKTRNRLHDLPVLHKESKKSYTNKQTSDVCASDSWQK